MRKKPKLDSEMFVKHSRKKRSRFSYERFRPRGWRRTPQARPRHKPKVHVPGLNTPSSVPGVKAGVMTPKWTKLVIPKGAVSNPLKPTYSYLSGSNCSVATFTGDTWPVFKAKTISSVKTLGFKTLKRRNLPFNPYTLSYEVVTTEQGSFLGANSAWPCLTGSVGYIHDSLARSVPFFYPIVTHSSPDTAVSKARAKAKGMKVNLAQTFGERRQTVGLMTTSVNRLVTGAMAIRNGNLKHAWNVFGGKPTKRKLQSDRIPPSPKNLANHWLEFQYGWKPLVSDIYGCAETLANLYYGNKSERVTARPTEERIVLLNQFIGNITGPIDGRDVWSEYCDTESVSRSTVILEFYEENPLGAGLASLGITNPALLVWELLPYSFVVDWFVPIGKFLDTIDATSSLSFKRGMIYTVTKRTDLFYWKRTGTSPFNSGATSELTGNTRTRQKIDKQRTVYTTFPMPSFPTFSPKLGIERITSGAALLTQVFSKR